MDEFINYFDFEIANVFETKWKGDNELKSAQRNDPELSAIIEHLEKGTMPSFAESSLKRYRCVWKRLRVENGILVKKGDKNVVVVPEAEVSSVLHHVHGGPVAAHYGISKCYYKLKLRFYFPNMVSRLSEYLESCESCLKRKMPLKEPKPIPTPVEYDHYDIGGCVA